ncbi:rhamnan synthesis F family protein [Legionella sp. D16C41]|uniref:rhamnan synthesis F family protein n=1 Tax=Legionella sp. D16C41 TaxID=3402688 RepID=UPI003AF6FF70
MFTYTLIKRHLRSPLLNILSFCWYIYNQFYKLCRRTIKILWWTLTLQLKSKLQNYKLQYSRKEDVHYLPLPKAYSLVVPFEYECLSKNSLPTIAVMCHMYYIDMLEIFKAYLTNIPYRFDLFITTDSEDKKRIIEANLSSWESGSVIVKIAPNRGRDIAPKLITFKEIYSKYEFCLHIHTKKSPYHEVHEKWRSYLLDNLLGSKKIVQSIFEIFKTEPGIGIIAPQHFWPFHSSIGWGYNFEIAQRFSSKLGLNLALDGRLDFPSGSMFWARCAALMPLLDCNLSFDDFPEEANQKDGTLAHVIERLYFLSCELAGFRWIKIISSSYANTTKRIIAINSPKDLKKAIIKSQYKLLTTSSDKSRQIDQIKNISTISAFIKKVNFSKNKFKVGNSSKR